MKLLYLYIGHLNRSLAYHEFSFSNDYLVHFERTKKALKIKKNLEKQIFTYADNISDLKLLVGKNGCGKSTILSLLGLSPQDLKHEFLQYENNDFPTQEQAYDWFALYHLENDCFALEGYNPSLPLENFGYYLQNHYSVSFHYDFAQNQMNDVKLLQESPNPATGHKYINQLALLFYQLEPTVSWYVHPKRRRYVPYNTCFFGRYDISQLSYYAMEHFLYLAAQKDAEFRPFFDNAPSALTVRLSLERSNINELTLSHQENSLAERIYGGPHSFLHMPVPQLKPYSHLPDELNCCHSMIIRYLEELLVFSLKENSVENEKTFTVLQQASESVRYTKRRDFLLDFISRLTKTPAPSDSYKNTIMDSYDLHLAKQFCAALEQIPEQFFLSGERAELPLSSCKTNFLESLMNCYDQNYATEDHELNHAAFLDFRVQNLSTGELALIDLYAAILSGITAVHQQASHIILLLDEPDSRLHPEWSRLFLKRLTSLLKSERFSSYQFQILIATHSPLLLSDVPKKDIICLDCTENSLIVTPANHGFMSNLNDILLDSMFLHSPFGAFAEEYTNQILSEIAQLKETLQNSAYNKNLLSQLDRLDEKISIIEEPYIRKVLQKSLAQLRELCDHQGSRKKRIQYLEAELKKLKALEEGP